jgi:hypothetical protein
MDIVKSVRLPPDILRTVKDRCNRERIDESTAIRQLLALGGERHAVELYRRGEVTLGEAARIANTTTREMIEVLPRHGVKGNMTMEMTLDAIESVRRLKRERSVSQAAR